MNEIEQCQAEIRRLREATKFLEKELAFYENAKVSTDKYGRYWLYVQEEWQEECRPIEYVQRIPIKTAAEKEREKEAQMVKTQNGKTFKIEAIRNALKENEVVSDVYGFNKKEIELWQKHYITKTGEDWNKTRKIEFWQKAERMCLFLGYLKKEEV